MAQRERVAQCMFQRRTDRSESLTQGPIFHCIGSKGGKSKDEEDLRQWVDPLKEEKSNMKGEIEEGRDSG